MFSLLHICDWRGRSSHLQKIEELLDRQLHAPGTTPSMQPFQAFMCQNISAEKEIHLARCYSERAKRNTTLLQMPPFRFRARLPSEPLHIGYVSSNFGNHTLGHMMQSKCFCCVSKFVFFFFFFFGLYQSNIVITVNTDIYISLFFMDSFFSSLFYFLSFLILSLSFFISFFFFKYNKKQLQSVYMISKISK